MCSSKEEQFLGGPSEVVVLCNMSVEKDVHVCIYIHVFRLNCPAGEGSPLHRPLLAFLGLLALRIDIIYRLSITNMAKIIQY